MYNRMLLGVILLLYSCNREGVFCLFLGSRPKSLRFLETQTVLWMGFTSQVCLQSNQILVGSSQKLVPLLHQHLCRQVVTADRKACSPAGAHPFSFSSQVIMRTSLQKKREVRGEDQLDFSSFSELCRRGLHQGGHTGSLSRAISCLGNSLGCLGACLVKRLLDVTHYLDPGIG